MALPAWAQHGSARGAGAPIGPPETPALFADLDAWQRGLEEQGWFLHGQATFVEQFRPAFRAPYRGDNSMQSAPMQRNTFSADLVLGRRLWEGAEFVLNPQVVRGFGLSGTRGIAAFPNGEAFRLGSETPTVFLARAFLRQTIGLGGEMVAQESDPMRFGSPLPRERLTLTAGKFSVFDIFDDNRYAHDPRTQFLNWAFVSAGAFDWVNDAKGFSEGVALEWEDGTWGVRAGAMRVARQVNALFLDPRIFQGWQAIGQLDHFHEIGGRPGAVRLIGGLSRTRSSAWGALPLDDPEATQVNTRGGYALKRMAVLNLEQEVAEDIGLFARLSWNDGRTQQWMYTEMDWAISAGAAFAGRPWGRQDDTVGLAANIGGLSAPHRRFLAAGGLGFIAGDGRLNYRPETAVEAYYDMHLGLGLHGALNAQLVVNPAHNADRGPIGLVALRLRTAF